MRCLWAPALWAHTFSKVGERLFFPFVHTIGHIHGVTASHVLAWPGGISSSSFLSPGNEWGIKWTYFGKEENGNRLQTWPRFVCTLFPGTNYTPVDRSQWNKLATFMNSPRSHKKLQIISSSTQVNISNKPLWNSPKKKRCTEKHRPPQNRTL